MALIKSAVRLIAHENQNYHFQGPALSLGVPEIYANYPELKEWLHFSSKKAEFKAVLSKNPIAQKFNWVSANTFYQMLGIHETISLDIPGAEHKPDIIHDLNSPLPKSLIGKFNLVIDPGTTEHIFDIKTALENIIKALKIGGAVIHHIPIYSFNGGYYNINPNVLFDFYQNNGFTNIKAYIIMWDRYKAYTSLNRCYRYTKKTFGQRHALADYDQYRYTPHLLFFASKKVEVVKIQIPIQEGIPEATVVDFQKSKHLQKILRAVPYKFSFYIAQYLRRQKNLRSTRKEIIKF